MIVFEITAYIKFTGAENKYLTCRPRFLGSLHFRSRSLGLKWENYPLHKSNSFFYFLKLALYVAVPDMET